MSHVRVHAALGAPVRGAHLVALSSTLALTFDGPLRGLPPTGARVDMQAHGLYRVRGDGRITSIVKRWDTAGFLRALGLRVDMPPPGPLPVPHRSPQRSPLPLLLEEGSVGGGGGGRAAAPSPGSGVSGTGDSVGGGGDSGSPLLPRAAVALAANPPCTPIATVMPPPQQQQQFEVLEVVRPPAAAAATTAAAAAAVAGTSAVGGGAPDVPTAAGGAAAAARGGGVRERVRAGLAAVVDWLNQPLALRASEREARRRARGGLGVTVGARAGTGSVSEESVARLARQSTRVPPVLVVPPQGTAGDEREGAAG